MSRTVMGRLAAHGLLTSARGTGGGSGRSHSQIAAQMSRALARGERNS